MVRIKLFMLSFFIFCCKNVGTSNDINYKDETALCISGYLRQNKLTKTNPKDCIVYLINQYITNIPISNNFSTKPKGVIFLQGLCEDYVDCFKEMKNKFLNNGYKPFCLRNIGNPESNVKDSVIPHSLTTEISSRASTISKLINESFSRYNPNTSYSLVMFSQGGLTGTLLNNVILENEKLLSLHYICSPFNGISYFNSLNSTDIDWDNIETCIEKFISMVLSKVSIITNSMCNQDILTLLCKPILCCFRINIPLDGNTQFLGARDMATNSNCIKIVKEKLIYLAKSNAKMHFYIANKDWTTSKQGAGAEKVLDSVSNQRDIIYRKVYDDKHQTILDNNEFQNDLFKNISKKKYD